MKCAATAAAAEVVDAAQAAEPVEAAEAVEAAATAATAEEAAAVSGLVCPFGAYRKNWQQFLAANFAEECLCGCV